MGGLPWMWFVTHTFPDRKHPEAADKLFRLWMSKLQRYIVGTKKWNKHPERTVRWIRGLEWQKRGVIHYHALLYTPSCSLDLRVVNRDDWEKEWRHLSGGYGKIDPVQDAGGAVAYITKYAVKGAAIDISRDICVEPQTPQPIDFKP